MKVTRNFRVIIVFLSLVSVSLCGLSAVNVFSGEETKEEEMIFLSKKAIEDGFYDVSLEMLERFLKQYPSSRKAPEAKVLIGECLFHKNNFLEALNMLKNLINDPACASIHDSAYFWTAETHFSGRDFVRAGQNYKKIIDDFPGSEFLEPAYYSLGWCVFQQGDFNQALGYFNLFKEKFPKSAMNYGLNLKITECLYNLKDYPGLKRKAAECKRWFSKDKAKSAYFEYYAAEAEFYLNNFAEALNAYSRAVADSDDPKIRALSALGRGWTYLKMKRLPEAEAALGQIQTQYLDKAATDVFLSARGIVLMGTREFSKAAEVYQELLAVTEDPSVLLQAYAGKAEALYNLNQFEQAKAVYSEALNRFSENTPQESVDKLYYGLAWTYLKNGQFKEAIAEFQKIARKSADKIIKVSALCQIGDAYQDLGDYDKARLAYDAVLKDYPDSFYGDYVQYQLGVVLLKLERYEAAVLAFQSFQANFPNSKLVDEAAYALGMVYFQREDYEMSLDTFRRFIGGFKDSDLRFQAMYLSGTSLYNLGRYNEAIEMFKEVIRANPQDAELLQKAEYEIADCYYQLGNEKEAIAKFSALRSKYPDSELTPEVIWWLGEYYYRRNELDTAQRYFSSLIRDFSSSNLVASCYYALGSIWTERGKYIEALGNFNKIREMTKSDLSGTASVAIADIYDRQNKSYEALQLYEATVESYPNLAGLIYPKIADVYLRAARYQDALNYYQKSLSLVTKKEMANIQFKIGQLKESANRPQEAIEDYLKIAYVYPENVELAVKSLLRVATIYENREEFEKAESIYSKLAVMNAEESKYARERIEWIKKRGLGGT